MEFTEFMGKRRHRKPVALEFIFSTTGMNKISSMFLRSDIIGEKISIYAQILLTNAVLFEPFVAH